MPTEYSLKQRFQTPMLGDTVRLQNWMFANALPASTKAIAKVEVFVKNKRLVSDQNPLGLSLKETIVSHFGQNPEIVAVPSSPDPDYWETRAYIDPENYEIADYVDRWHIILDPDFTFEYPLARDPYSQYSSNEGWERSSVSTKTFTYHDGTQITTSADGNWDVVDDDGTWEVSLHDVALTNNRFILPDGIKSASGTKLTPQQVVDAINDSDENVSSAVLSSAFIDDPGSIVLVVKAGYTGNPNAVHVGGQYYSFAKLASIDSEDWQGVLSNVSGAPAAPGKIDAKLLDDGRTVQVRVYWPAGTAPSRTKVIPYFVDRWKISGLTYNAQEANPWDDLIARTSNQYKATVDHRFTIYPSLWLSYSRPISVEYDFKVDPNEYYVNTRQWMRVTVEPRIPLNPEAQRYHYSLISMGRMRFEMYKVMPDGVRLSKVKEGMIDWHEENVGMLRLDTRVPPLNRNIDLFVIFYIDLPDGSTIRSGRVFVRIIDDTVSNISTMVGGGII